MTTSPVEIPSRIPHRIGALLTVLVFPLIWLGGLVTTYDAGMAVPDWPGTYGYNMFLYPVETWLFGPFDLLVEHGHRLLASLSGIVAIVLVVATFKVEPRRWVRWFSVILLLLIILQGGLGGARVLMDERIIAKIHGCVGPTFFISVVAFCVVTSRWWFTGSRGEVMPTSDQAGPRWLGRFAIFMLLLCLSQLVLGALVRHVGIDSSPRAFRGLIFMHVGMAFVIVLGTIIHWIGSRRTTWSGSGIRTSVNMVAILVLTQFSLGLGTWVVKWGWPAWFADQAFASSYIVGEKTFFQMNLVTAHVAVGSLILAFWTIHAIRCLRLNHRWKHRSANKEIAGDMQTRPEQFQLSQPTEVPVQV
ncbi:MAG: COX15/CtaA family protein [Planctomycetota bacterium]